MKRNHRTQLREAFSAKKAVVCAATAEVVEAAFRYWEPAYHMAREALTTQSSLFHTIPSHETAGKGLVGLGIGIGAVAIVAMRRKEKD